MNGSRAPLAAIVCGASFAVAACGTATHRSSTAQSRPAMHYASETSQSGRSIGAGTIVLRRLGTIRFACAGSSGITAVLDPRGVLATESAYVEGAGHQHLRGGTIQPGDTGFTVTAPTSRSELWHVIQETEPETLDARITVTVSASCTGQWLARVGVISHAGTWSPPQPWL